MERNKGFTLIELMVVVAILGIMAATALPLYRTFQQRAYGSEASIMAKRILDGQIAYFLENEKFFPEDDSRISIDHADLPTKAEIQWVKNALNIEIPVGHFLNYDLQAFNVPGAESFSVSIRAAGNFPLFSEANTPGSIIASIDNSGKVLFVIPGKD